MPNWVIASMAKGENRMMRRRLRNAYLSTVISISLVLLLVGVASLLLVNANAISDYFKENMKISVLMDDGVSDSAAQKYQATLDAMDFVKSTEFISREQGAEELARMLGDDFLDAFDATPVPASIEVTLKAQYVSTDSVKVVQKTLESSPLVDEVSYQQSLLDALNSNLSKIGLVLGVFILLLLFISFVLINNTVRLNVFSRRFTIHTMKLVGATKSFIRGPFLVKSIFQGLFSACIAIIFLLGVLYFLKGEFSQLFDIFTLKMLLVVMGVVLVAGVLICLISTYFVVNRLVSLSKDELYY